MLKANATAELDKSTAPPVSVAPDQRGCAPSFLTQQKNEMSSVLACPAGIEGGIRTTR